VLPPNKTAGKQADGMSSLQYSWLMVGFCSYYSVYSTYNFDTYQFGFQHELVSLVAYCAPKAHAPLAQKLSVPQPQTETIRGKLSAESLERTKYIFRFLSSYTPPLASRRTT
jgi:hypothetical protein